jgi:hypothetical protein
MAAHPSHLRLGELDLSSVLDELFQLGELLARINASGGLLQPLSLAKVSLTMPLGQWEVTRAEYITLSAFTPALAAQQFVEFEDEALRTILGGYARLAYQRLDPQYPGFTDSLLAQLLPGVEVMVPKPLPIRFDLAAVLQAYGTSLAHYIPAQQDLAVTPRPPAVAPSEEDLLVASLVLFVAQRDLTAWLRHVAACEPTRHLAQVLGALARGEFATSGWSGLLPKLLSWVVPQEKKRPEFDTPSAQVSVGLAVLTEVYAEPGRLDELYKREAAFRVLRTALDQLPPNSPETSLVRPQLLASVIDGLHALAKQADVTGQVVASMQFAQLALMALQLLPAPADPTQAEAWLARVQAQEYTYQWSRLAPDQPLNAHVVRSFGGYAGSARLVASLWSTAAGTWYSQGRVTNQLWTATWFGLERLRLALRLFYALSQQEPMPVGQARQQATLALKSLLDHYRQAQREIAAMLRRNLQPGREMSLWVQVMLDEGCASLANTQVGYDLRALAPVEDALRRHGYGPKALTQLGKLAASLVPRLPERYQSMAGAVPEDPLPGYQAEEDVVYQHVLASLLQQAYVAETGRIQRADGTPLIPPPPTPLSGAELAAYREAWLSQHPTEVSPPGVLNLSPTLHSLPECVAEYRFLVDQPALPVQTHALQQLANELWVASLGTRPFTPLPAPQVWRYTCYWRYAPFQQYAEPAGSQGAQLGLRLSRVGFNSARDTGFFFYDLDYGSHIVGGVAFVRKQAGCWVVQQET